MSSESDCQKVTVQKWTIWLSQTISRIRAGKHNSVVPTQSPHIGMGSPGLGEYRPGLTWINATELCKGADNNKDTCVAWVKRHKESNETRKQTKSAKRRPYSSTSLKGWLRQQPPGLRARSKHVRAEERRGDTGKAPKGNISLHLVCHRERTTTEVAPQDRKGRHSSKYVIARQNNRGSNQWKSAWSWQNWGRKWRNKRERRSGGKRSKRGRK